MLNVLWRYPIVVLMKGVWKWGKTDTSLLMAYLSKKWGLIDKIGANIWTFDNPEVDHIINLHKLKLWLHADKLRKLFLFDEALKHAYRRKAMSKKNIAIITEILPELSKGHGRMVVISQTEKVDSDILDPVFCRAVWEKKSKKTMFCTSRHHAPQTFYNLPSVQKWIKFDPDRLAPFIITELSKKKAFTGGSEIYEVARLYAKGKSFTEIKTELDLHQEKIKRDIRKALGRFIEYEDEARDAEQENGEIRESGDIRTRP